MREAKVAVLPGKKTKMWTYGGTLPGPDDPPSRRRADRGHVRALAAGEGGRAHASTCTAGHNRSSEDGQPGGLTARQPRALYCDISSKLAPADSGNDLLIAPGGRRTYTYDLIEDGGPERAAFQWYHDHRLERTAPNVWRGLAGMMDHRRRLRGLAAAADRRSRHPADDRRPLVRQAQPAHDPFTSSGGAPDDGIVGRLALVNGVHLPFHRVAAARYRLRILNAANFSLYNLELSNGDRLVQIATESGLMPAPVRRKKALIGPGERVELIVDFTKLRGQARRAAERQAQDERGDRLEDPTTGPLMRVPGRWTASPTRPPSRRRCARFPAGPRRANQQPDRKWEFTISKGLRARPG